MVGSRPNKDAVAQKLLAASHSLIELMYVFKVSDRAGAAGDPAGLTVLEFRSHHPVKRSQSDEHAINLKRLNVTPSTPSIASHFTLTVDLLSSRTWLACSWNQNEINLYCLSTRMTNESARKCTVAV